MIFSKASASNLLRESITLSNDEKKDNVVPGMQLTTEQLHSLSRKIKRTLRTWCIISKILLNIKLDFHFFIYFIFF